MTEFNEEDEHPKLAEEGLCRASYTGPTGIVWICIRKAHNPVYKRKKGDRRHGNGTEVSGTGSHLTRWESPQAAPADRHLYVNRYPYRPISKENS